MELDLNVALPSDEQLSQEKLRPIKKLRDFDLNVTLNEVDCGDMNITPPEVLKNEMIIQSSPTEWNYSDHQASQILTQVRASSVGGTHPKRAPDFAAALAKAARVYNKVKVSSDPEPKLKRLVRIAPKPPSMRHDRSFYPMPNDLQLQQPYLLQPFQLQHHPSSSAVKEKPAAGSTDHDIRLEKLKPTGVFRPIRYWGQKL